MWYRADKAMRKSIFSRHAFPKLMTHAFYSPLYASHKNDISCVCHYSISKDITLACDHTVDLTYPHVLGSMVVGTPWFSPQTAAYIDTYSLRICMFPNIKILSQKISIKSLSHKSHTDATRRPVVGHRFPIAAFCDTPRCLIPFPVPVPSGRFPSLVFTSRSMDWQFVIVDVLSLWYCFEIEG